MKRDTSKATAALKAAAIAFAKKPRAIESIDDLHNAANAWVAADHGVDVAQLERTIGAPSAPADHRREMITARILDALDAWNEADPNPQNLWSGADDVADRLWNALHDCDSHVPFATTRAVIAALLEVAEEMVSCEGYVKEQRRIAALEKLLGVSRLAAEKIVGEHAPRSRYPEVPS